MPETGQIEASIEPSGAGRFLVSGALVFETVAALRHASRAQLRGVADATFDLKSVTRSDSAGLALLVSWLRDAHEDGRTVHFENLPKQLAAIAHTCGLEWLPGVA
ncbi:MAG: STAS domain-containing protein [Gammaproteobacteria bacterium]|nr:STAS domain-containing protein [Gammaproteobacteria bacterium]